MKLICAGVGKTGSKTCSAALRELGYSVGDSLETIESLGPIWVEYIEGKVTIQDVIAEYDKHGFDANQDLPGNLLWEDLYNAMGSKTGNETKVILTIRDSDEKWFQSFYNFSEQEMRRHAIGDFNVQG